MKKTKICNLLNIEYPIIQGGMVWASGAHLAAASSNAGCLGVIGAGSMTLELLESHITKALLLTNKPLAVNFPIMYEKSKQQIDLAYELGIRIFILSAGSPKKYTSYLKDKGCIVMHVTSSLKLAKKCEDAGVDIVIVEGFEAGGHNGRDEITSLVLTPQVSSALSIPVITAGGFGCGRSIVAALALGASGVQMGTRFLLTKESSAHDNFKKLLINSPETGTKLMMKSHVPVRMFKNSFYDKMQELEETELDIEKQKTLLGKGRAKSGIFEGDLEDGELEIGQIYCTMDTIPTVAELVTNLKEEYQQALDKII
jgi:enoyl-[acyl-carrier protein] reductase II